MRPSAASRYWPSKERLARFAYAAQHSGGEQVVEQLAGIGPRDLEAVAASVRSRMEQDAAYRAMKTKGPVFGAPRGRKSS